MAEMQCATAGGGGMGSASEWHGGRGEGCSGGCVREHVSG